MVRGYITWEGVGALHICAESANVTYYSTILESNLRATTSVSGVTGEVLLVQDGHQLIAHARPRNSWRSAASNA